MILLSCTESGRGPTSPSALQLSPPTLSWECGRQGQLVAAQASGWSFPAAPASCPAIPLFAQEVGIGLVSLAPGNLRSTISGTTVRLDWASVPEVVTSFLVEAGSGATLANLAILNTGSSATSLTVENVPLGVYYVRVRGVGSDGIPGPPSNEIIVRVGVACSAAPGAPLNLTRLVIGNQVTLSWLAPTTGDQSASYSIEAGSEPGLSNIIVFNTGGTATAISAVAPDGLYFVRLRGVNGCGTSAASNEIAVGVNVPEPPTDPVDVSPPSPPPAPPPAPPPGTGGGGTSPPACTYTVGPALVTVGDAANTFDVSVTAVTGCAWSASSLSPFVTLAAAGSGGGNGVARFFVSANSSATVRTGTVRISWATGSSETSVSQAAQTSEPIENFVTSIVPVSPPVAAPPMLIRGPRPHSGAGPIVGTAASPGTTPDTTLVTVTSTTPFDTVIVSGDTTVMSGPARVRTMAVAEAYFLLQFANPTMSATMTITTPSGPTFTAEFAARLGDGPVGNYASVSVTRPPCTYSITPPTVTVPGAGATFNVTVVTSPGCPWVASTLSPFITVHNPRSFKGGGFATFVLNANTGAVDRTGAVRISWPLTGTFDISVIQPARP